MTGPGQISPKPRPHAARSCDSLGLCQDRHPPCTGCYAPSHEAQCDTDGDAPLDAIDLVVTTLLTAGAVTAAIGAAYLIARVWR